MSETSNSSNASLIGGLAAAVVLALGVGVLVYRQPASVPASPAPLSSPSGATETSPAPEASPEAAASPDASAPEAAAPASAPAGAKKGAGSASSPGGKAAGPAPDKGTPAAKTADKGSPAGPRGTAGAPPPLTSQAMMRRTFVASRTSSESVKGGSKTLSGFDAKKSKDVQVKRAAEVDGRIEFSSTPQRVKPGDKYKIRVGFVNEGKRTIEIKELVVTTKVNGKANREALKPMTREIASRQNEILYELAGTWDKTTTSWSVEAEVMSTRLDAYRNHVVWK